MKVTKDGKGNAVYLESVGIWWDEKSKSIHIVAHEVEGFHTTVNQIPGSKRSHPNLFDKLAMCLRDNGVPAPSLTTD